MTPTVPMRDRYGVFALPVDGLDRAPRDVAEPVHEREVGVVVEDHDPLAWERLPDGAGSALVSREKRSMRRR